MKQLSSPIDLIKKAINIFFKKENAIYFLKIFSITFLLSTVSFTFSYIVSKAGYTADQYVNQFLKGNILIIVLVFVWSIIAFLAGLWAHVSGYESVKRVVTGGKLEFKDTYKSSLRYIGRFFLVSFLAGLITVFGIILLIIPGIIFAVWYAFSLWFVVDKNRGVGESLRESKLLVKGRFWKVFGRIIVFILFAILGQIVFSLVPQGFGTTVVTIFGGLFLLPYYLLYQELESHQESASDSN